MSDLDRLADDYNAMRQERDDARDRARRACQILIKEIGAEGPADVEVVAERAACEIQRLRDLQEETEHQMHLRIRAGYDKTIADSWRAKVAEVEAERDEARAEVERLREAMTASMNLCSWECSDETYCGRCAPLVRVLDGLGCEEHER